MDIQLADRLFG